jgi:S-adenosylmethionine:diacylglycerol 3-amino-3-carboxypropyl transferase
VLQSEDVELDVTQVYGAEHLLRLMGMSGSRAYALKAFQRTVCVVKLPAMLAMTDLNARAMRSLALLLEDLLRYMEKHAKTLFVNKYMDTSDGYQGLATKGKKK